MSRLILLVPFFVVACVASPKGAPMPVQGNVSSRAAVPIAPFDGNDESFLQAMSATGGFGMGVPFAFRPLPGGSQALFLRSTATDARARLYVMDVNTGLAQELVTLEQVLGHPQSASLSPEEKALRERMRVRGSGFTGYELSFDGKSVLLSLGGRLAVVDMATRKVVIVAKPDAKQRSPFDARFSPDGLSVSFVRAGELWTVSSSGGEDRQLTRGATELVTHAQAEFVAQEEMNRFSGYWWSGDSRRVVYQVSDGTGVERLHITDPADPSQQKILSYPRPGKNNVVVSLGIMARAGGKATWIQWDKVKYPYLTRVRWQKNAPLTIEVQTRDQHDLLLLRVDPVTGKTATLHSEHDEVWLNLGNDYRWLADGSAFVWSTERAGAWQLELRDKKGALIRTLTEGRLGLRGVRHLDERAVVVAAGAHSVEQQLYRIPIQGDVPTLLTQAPGFYDAVFAEDTSAYVLSVSALDHPTRAAVWRGGAERAVIASVAAPAPRTPRVELVQVGERKLWASIARPKNFDSAKMYAVLVYVYGGPHVNLVRSSMESHVKNQWIADHGYIVVSIDGRGTPRRGRAFERAIFAKFAEIPLEDQVAGLLALAKIEPSMDLSRVGIFGSSFGGYMSALAVLRRPEIFHAGFASAPVSDWLDYDTHYTERYLGLPGKDRAVYDKNGLLAYTKELRRPLLVVHGTADDNVHLSHSIKLVDRLFRASQEVEFVPVAGRYHRVTGPGTTAPYYRRMFSFFRAALDGALF